MASVGTADIAGERRGREEGGEIGWGDERGELAMVMALVEGVTCTRKILKQNGRADTKSRVFVLGRI